MTYTKTNWQNDQAPAINATNLNKIEQGIFNNDALLSSIMNTLGIDTQTWVSTDSYVEGQVVVYNNQLYKNITGNYTTTTPDEDTTNWSLTNMKDMQYPVGKVEIFYDTLDHSNYMGFTWERYAEGRVLVGQDTNDSDFDTIGETGGTKTHKHTGGSHTHGLGNGYACIGTGWDGTNILRQQTKGTINAGTRIMQNMPGYNNSGSSAYDSTALGGSTDGGGVVDTSLSSSLQPYTVVSIWKRIS